VPTDESWHTTVPDAHIEGKFNPPVMTTADLALKFDPAYKAIAERFLANPDEYQLAFAKAWYKLTHRDMGPKARLLGDEVPAETLVWQDPIPAVNHPLVNQRDINQLKRALLNSELTGPELIRTAWAAASSFRASDMRGGANGARLALEPQKNWAVNNPAEIEKVLNVLKGIQQDFNNRQRGNKRISLADLIVLGGAAAIEQAAEAAGYSVTVPFIPGRADATQTQTDVASFAHLEPKADAFRNYYSAENYKSSTEALIDKADQLKLTVPEMTVLLGGLRALDANTNGASHGVLTDQPGTLNNDFFVNLLDMSTQWRKADAEGIYEGVDRKNGEVKYTATMVDLIFGHHAELRAVSEVYAMADGEEKFVNDFVAAWHKVMTLDRFDI
jgi:catalase-peroxidase